MIGSSDDRVYNPARMAEAERAYGLITSRRAAVASITLTGFVAATTFRNVFFHPLRHPHAHGLLSWAFGLPKWA